MITEKDYQISRKFFKICRVFLIISILLFVANIVAFCIDGGGKTPIISALINICLFAILTIQHHKKIKEYEVQTKE